MSSPPRTVRADASIEEALVLMRDGACRRLPVVDFQGALVGLLSLDDALVALSSELSLVKGLLEAQSPGAAARVLAGGGRAP